MAKRKTKPIFIKDYPADDFKFIEQEAIRNGVANTASGVVRWALTQFANVLRERKAEASGTAGR